MNKAKLVKSVSRATGIDGKTVEYVLDATLAAIQDAVVDGDSVTVQAFGTFCRQYRKAKVGRNFKNNSVVEIPPHYVASFKPSKEFSEAVKVSV